MAWRFGVLPEAAQALRANHALIALVHHPLALESGLRPGRSCCPAASERAALACARHVVATSAATARLLAADYDVAADASAWSSPGTDRVEVAPRSSGTAVALLAVGAVVPRKGYDVLSPRWPRSSDLPWRLVIAGDRTRRPETLRGSWMPISLRRGLAARVACAGRWRRASWRRSMRSADLFVLPSRFEGYGMAYAEAHRAWPASGRHDRRRDPGNSAGRCRRAGRRRTTLPRLRRCCGCSSKADGARNGSPPGRVAAQAFPTWQEQAALFARVLERSHERLFRRVAGIARAL